MTIQPEQSIYPGKSIIQSRKLPFFLPLLLLAACTGMPEDDRSSLPPPLYQQPQTVIANPKGGYAVNPATGDSIQPLVNSLGDTLITGVRIPLAIGIIHGKRIHPDSVAKPKVVKAPALSSLERHSAQTKRYEVPENLPTYPVDKSKLIKKSVPQVATGDTTHYLQNSTGRKVPTGVRIPAQGKKVPTSHPPAIQALHPAMKDAAIANIQYLDAEQGMTGFNVWTILEDKKGNLWFGTDSGVSKYDGQSFTHFTQKEGLSSDRFRSIVEDKNGNLWFGTIGGGVSKYDGQSFTHFTEKEGLSNNRVFSIVEDKNGNLWFCTEGGGVSKYDGQSFTHFTEKEGLSSNKVSSVIEDKNGNLWFGTWGGGVNKYDGQSFTHFTEKDGLNNNIVRSVLEDKNGNLWFGTEGGLSKYDGQSFTYFTEKDGLSNSRVRSIVEDKNGNLWFGTDSGISKYDGQFFTHFTEKEGLSNNMVWSIVEDNSGNLWFGTIGGGVSKYDGKSFTHFTEKEGLSNNMVRSVVEDRKGNLWFGTDGGGVSQYDGKSFIQFTGKEGLSNNRVGSILEDKNGNLWFCTEGGGISKYDGRSFTHLTEKEGLNRRFVFSIVEDKKGNLWFGTDAGIGKYDGQSFTRFTEKEGLSNNIVLSIVEDKRGHLWFGTYGSGVSEYDGQSFTHLTEKEGLGNNRVSSIVEDKKGNLWFGTVGGGVSKYDGKSFTHFTKKQGLSDNNVLSIVEDKKGNLWFGTAGGGVSKYDGQSFTYFTKKEGLSNNKVRSILEDKTGNLWFGTDGGVSKMDKDVYQSSPPPLVVNLRQLYIDEAVPDYRNASDSSIQDIKFDSVQAFENYPVNPKIPSSKNHLGFQYSAIDWSAPSKIKYSFRLLGLDNKWSNPSAKNLADYRNLPDGKFTFQVRAVGESGEWSQAFEYSFTILPPWWKTWWACTLYALLFLGALRTFSLWRERKLQQEKEQLQQKVEERTFELKKSLADLKSTQAQLIQSEKLASLGELTAGIAHEIQNPLNFVNNFSEINRELITEMKEEIEKGNYTEVKAIAEDLETNEERINHHGQRASSIVKGMLEHSRASTGVKEPTDLNALADEFLRLAYHGLRAKDNNFNATMETHFDPDLPLVSVIPQDIGRVLLNLINNAFYAVQQRASVRASLADALLADAHGQPTGTREGRPYQPTITITTQKTADLVIIKIQDNGNGIPEAIREKIFQPFFTTKPTGQGTGLGLSLAYDIVTKGHGGTLSVQSVEAKGTEFIITLPTLP